jgi:hypothetical protein
MGQNSLRRSFMNFLQWKFLWNGETDGWVDLGCTEWRPRKRSLPEPHLERCPRSWPGYEIDFIESSTEFMKQAEHCAVDSLPLPGQSCFLQKSKCQLLARCSGSRVSEPTDSLDAERPRTTHAMPGAERLVGKPDHLGSTRGAVQSGTKSRAIPYRANTPLMHRNVDRKNPGLRNVRAGAWWLRPGTRGVWGRPASSWR